MQLIVDVPYQRQAIFFFSFLFFSSVVLKRTERWKSTRKSSRFAAPRYAKGYGLQGKRPPLQFAFSPAVTSKLQ